MTAAGKITTANLEVGTRILIVRESDATAQLMERDAEMIPARKQTGATVARVLEVRAGTRRRYESNVPREVVTTAGVVRAYGHQTFILAPETPAAVKKAHAEAMIEDAAFDAARQEQADAEATERRAAFEARGEKAPIVGDFVTFIGESMGSVSGRVTETIGRMVSVDWVRHSTGQTGFDRPTDGEFAGTWQIVTSEDWHERAIRCPNRWHRTASARMRQLCPECPAH